MCLTNEYIKLRSPKTRNVLLKVFGQINKYIFNNNATTTHTVYRNLYLLKDTISNFREADQLSVK